MRKCFKISIFLLLFVSAISEVFSAQSIENDYIDSLITVLDQQNFRPSTHHRDTLSINLMLEIGQYYIDQRRFAEAMPYAIRAARALKNMKEIWQIKSKIAHVHYILGNIYSSQGRYTESLKNFYASINLNTDIAIHLSETKFLNVKRMIAKANSGIGNIYSVQSDYPKSLNHYFIALKIAEEQNNKRGIGALSNNIGIIYMHQHNYKAAFTYYKKALQISEEISSEFGQAMVHNNIGQLFDHQDNYKDALTHYSISLEIKKKIQDSVGIAASLNNIGTVFINKTKMLIGPDKEEAFQAAFLEAEKYTLESLTIRRNIDDKRGVATSTTNLGYIYIALKKYNLAQDYLKEGIKVGREINSLHILGEAYFNLALLDSATQNFKGACLNYAQNLTIYDSIYTEEKSLEIGKLIARNEFDVAEIRRIRTEKLRSEMQAASIMRRDRLQYSISLLICVVLITAMLFFKRFKISAQLKNIAAFLSFLIIFEFILILIEPISDSFTGSVPIYKLAINIFLASLSFPFYRKLAQMMGLNETSVQSQDSQMKPNNRNTNFFLCLAIYLTFSLIQTPFGIAQDSVVVQGKEFGIVKVTEKGKKLEVLKNKARELKNELQELRRNQQYEKAYTYLKLYSQLGDSIRLVEKAEEFGLVQEQHKLEIQQEHERLTAEENAQRLRELESRKRLVQYSGILVFILLLFGILFLGGRIKLNSRYTEGIIYISFLVFFEFVILIFDPTIEQISGGGPGIKLCINVVIAGAIAPLHQFCESKLKKVTIKSKINQM